MVSWSKVDDFYRQSAWKAFSIAFLAANPHCCVAGCTDPARHADHIKPISQGGSGFDPQNLQPMCLSHHNAKTAKQRATRPSKSQRLAVRGCGPDGYPSDPGHAWYQDKR